jgi:hypothetical protein
MEMENMTNVETQELLTALRNEIVRLVEEFEIKTGMDVEVVKPRRSFADGMTVDASFKAS